MVRIKKLLEGTLSLENHATQISETYAIIKSFNKLTRLSMSKAQVIV
ncbi:hypothetical protein [Candidatus Enterovibrio altilux]|nr:hypothetical protein [Candidatus Enterovibrio luxaltus]